MVWTMHQNTYIFLRTHICMGVLCTLNLIIEDSFLFVLLHYVILAINRIYFCRSVLRMQNGLFYLQEEITWLRLW